MTGTEHLNTLRGFDQYSGSWRTVSVQLHGPHVVIQVEATSGAAEGEAILTSVQARIFAGWLLLAADAAERREIGK